MVMSSFNKDVFSIHMFSLTIGSRALVRIQAAACIFHYNRLSQMVIDYTGKLPRKQICSTFTKLLLNLLCVHTFLTKVLVVSDNEEGE